MRAIAAGTAALALLSCDRPDRLIVDGYTLHGVVLNADTGQPVSDVGVFVGSEDSGELHWYSRTDTSGTYTFQPSPNTAPSRELFQFEKPGFITRQVLARTALRVEESRYRLVVRLEHEP